MAATPMTVTMREKYEGMIRSRFQSIIDEAEIINAAEKEQIQQEVKHDFGIYKLEAEIAAIELQHRELKSKREVRAGTYDRLIKSEVERRLSERNGVYAKLMYEQTQAIESVWLAGAPDIVVSLLSKVEAMIPVLLKEIIKTRQLKELDMTKKRIKAPGK